MSRSVWKSPSIHPNFLKSIVRAKAENKKKPKITLSRASTIYPAAIGLLVKIHNGNRMVFRKITEEMVGHKLGEFALTRKKYIYKKKKNPVKR
uniref:Small ribosomal subunit protein uS19c n=1 Tax=Schizocladia ischiensis TaxID=196139 RepID=A0A7S6UA12_9STRA|nr:ribosomal protein S19 [Schizocladia ischiensis]QOW07596.1 ribosomal protein S19 [Schizocladia ischiensis]